MVWLELKITCVESERLMMLEAFRSSYYVVWNINFDLKAISGSNSAVWRKHRQNSLGMSNQNQEYKARQEYTCQHRASSLMPSAHSHVKDCKISFETHLCKSRVLFLMTLSIFLIFMQKEGRVRSGREPISAMTASARVKKPFSSLLTCHAYHKLWQIIVLQ